MFWSLLCMWLSEESLNHLRPCSSSLSQPPVLPTQPHTHTDSSCSVPHYDSLASPLSLLWAIHTTHIQGNKQYRRTKSTTLPDKDKSLQRNRSGNSERTEWGCGRHWSWLRNWSSTCVRKWEPRAQVSVADNDFLKLLLNVMPLWSWCGHWSLLKPCNCTTKYF